MLTAGLGKVDLVSLISSSYRSAFDHLLSKVDPEQAHQLGFAAVKLGRPISERVFKVDSDPISKMGISFPAKLGLAAGFDKNGTGIDALAALGFGFIEIGTVTGLPQPGNPRPRLQRLVADRAIVNRMGFNNDGAQAVARRLALRVANGPKSQVPLGINIGKSKVVPEHEAIASEQPKPSPEFAVLEDEPDDDAIRAKALNQNFRGLARQAALDPDDGLGL